RDGEIHRGRQLVEQCHEEVHDAFGVGHQMGGEDFALTGEREAIGRAAEALPEGRFRFATTKEHRGKTPTQVIGSCCSTTARASSGSRTFRAGSCNTSSSNRRSVHPSLGPGGMPTRCRSTPFTARSPISTGSRKAI